jgi:hypothetical protein
MTLLSKRRMTLGRDSRTAEPVQDTRDVILAGACTSMEFSVWRTLTASDRGLRHGQLRKGFGTKAPGS